MAQHRVRSFLGAVLLVLTLGFPSSAVADTIGFEGSIAFVGVGHGTSVTANLTTSGSTYTALWAGEINWQWVGEIPETFSEYFFAYCVDLSQLLQTPQDVLIISSDGFTNGVEDGGTKAAWLFNNFALDIRDEVVDDANLRAAALQIAIWEAMYDTIPDLDPLTGGAFTLATTGLVRTYADSYLSALYATDWSSASAYILKTSEQRVAGQDQITNVPEPATAMLVGLGLVAALRSRNRRQSA